MVSPATGNDGKYHHAIAAKSWILNNTDIQ